MCGATYVLKYAIKQDSGLSPRVRGNQEGRMAYGSRLRSIPACAGQPSRVTLVGGRSRRGLSPRVRGNHYSGLCAIWSWFTVYPRVCGATVTMVALSRRNHLEVLNRPHGSIPACAGQPRRAGAVDLAEIRSIPACAGQPRVHLSRVCGATGHDHVFTRKRPRSIPACAGQPYLQCPEPRRMKGLSPRVRGNRSLH